MEHQHDPNLRPSTLTRHLLHAVSSMFVLVWALFCAPPGGAIGPEAPVDFLDTYILKGFMLLVIDPKQVANLQVMRIVHQDGEPLSREAVEWKRLRMFDYTAPITRPDDFQYRDPDEHRKPESDRAQSAPASLPSIESAQLRPDLRLADSTDAVVVSDAPPRWVGVLIPLDSKAQYPLKDGAYAEKFIARAQLAGESAKSKPLTMVRWSHFVMRDRKAHFISQAEYSQMIDPATDGVDGSGEKVQLNSGRGVKADVPIRKTKKYRAVPLGRLGGVAPERATLSKDAPRNETLER